MDRRGVRGRRYDLEDRLLAFAAMIVDLAEALPKTLAGTMLGTTSSVQVLLHFSIIAKRRRQSPRETSFTS
jgi:hypothetical protein